MYKDLSHVFTWWLVIVSKLFHNHTKLTFNIIVKLSKGCAVVVKNCVHCRVSDSISLNYPLPLLFN